MRWGIRLGQVKVTCDSLSNVWYNILCMATILTRRGPSIISLKWVQLWLSESLTQHTVYSWRLLLFPWMEPRRSGPTLYVHMCGLHPAGDGGVKCLVFETPESLAVVIRLAYCGLNLSWGSSVDCAACWPTVVTSDQETNGNVYCLCAGCGPAKCINMCVCVLIYIYSMLCWELFGCCCYVGVNNAWYCYGLRTVWQPQLLGGSCVQARVAEMLLDSF